MMIFLSFLYSFFWKPAFQEVKIDLSLHISNIRSADAPLRMALYDKGAHFPDERGFKSAKIFIPGKTGEVTFVFAGLDAGEYVVAIYQDMDNNAKLNTNFFGSPKEPYCFSNNIKPSFSAPSFRQCKFLLSSNSHDVFVKLID